VDEQQTVELPVMKENDTIAQAFGVLREHGKGAIVVPRRRGPAMLTARNLTQALAGRSGHDVQLVDVVREVESAPEHIFDRFAPRSTNPMEDRYTVIRIDSTSATVSMSNRQARKLENRITLYVCTGNSNHVWLEDDLVRPGLCNLDGRPVEPLD
jgi:hypothetical protein